MEQNVEFFSRDFHVEKMKTISNGVNVEFSTENSPNTNFLGNMMNSLEKVPKILSFLFH